MFWWGTGNDVIEERKHHKHHAHHKNYSHHPGYYNDLKSSQLHSRRKRSIGKPEGHDSPSIPCYKHHILLCCYKP